jgi:uncharacterized protein YycO
LSKPAAKFLLLLYIINFTIFPPQARSRGLSLNYDASIFQDGDIIFRRGRSLVSQIVLSADERSPYSHVGLIKLIEGHPFVAHVTTSDPPGSPDIARLDPLDSFLSDDRALSAAVFRVKDTARRFAGAAVDAALSYVEKRVPFDDEMDLRTTDKLYCTEMVWRAYLEAGLDLVNGKFDRLRIPLGKEIYLLPSSLTESEWLERVCHINSTR